MVQGVVSLERRRTLLTSHLLDRILEGEVDAHRGRLGALALLLHCRLEPIKVDCQALILRDFLGELKREAIGVVQLKGLGTADLGGLGGQHLRQQLLAPLQGLQEARFLPLQFGQDHFLALDDAGVSPLEQCNRRRPHGDEEGLIDAQ